MAAEESQQQVQAQQQGGGQQQQLQQQQQQQRKPGEPDPSLPSREDLEKQLQHQSHRTVERQKKHENAIKQHEQHQRDNSAHFDNSEQANRTRSASRRARRKRIQAAMQDGKYMMTNSLEALEEADASGELAKMGMFERIGPDSTSMDGPVTHARAMRGEIPVRGTDPNQPKWMPPDKKQSELADTEGLKLTLEANLDIEIELKASIRGDLTLSLFA